MRVYRNFFTVVLLTFGVFVTNVVGMLYAGHPSGARFDYLALAASFIGVLICRETLDVEPRRRSLLLWFGVGTSLVLAGAMLIAAWSAWTDQGGIYPPVPSSRPLELASSILFIVSILLLFVKDTPETIFLLVLKPLPFLFALTLSTISILAPAALMTYLSFVLFRYPKDFVNHATVFGASIAFVIALREAFARAKSKFPNAQTGKP
jgi:hypothetical protein